VPQIGVSGYINGLATSLMQIRSAEAAADDQLGMGDTLDSAGCATCSP
jgi:hypothetical protein